MEILPCYTEWLIYQQLLLMPGATQVYRNSTSVAEIRKIVAALATVKIPFLQARNGAS